MNGKSARLVTLLATAVLLSALPSRAIPRSGEGSGMHYLVSAEGLSSWHVGAYQRYHDREVKTDGRKTGVDFTHTMAYVGHDVLSWVSLYGLVGLASCQEELFNRSEDAFEYGVGAWFNLLDHDTLEYLTTVQRFRVQGALQYTMLHTDEVTWGELAGNLTFGVTHEIIGNKFLWPEAVTLYGGPAVNIVVSDEYDQSGDGMVGFVVGVDLQLNRLTSLGASMELYDEDEASVGYVSVRF